MAHSKTSKRVYKKHTNKRKTQKGGDIELFGYTCEKIEKVKPTETDGAAAEPVDDDANTAAEDEDDEEETAKTVETAEVDEDAAADDEADEEETAEEEPTEEEPADEEQPKEDNNGGMFGAGGKKSRKHKSRKGARKTAKKPKSAWTTFVTKLYKKNKLANPLYMFKDALKDAAKLYKK